MKDSKRNTINLIFSAFLVIGYIVCTYFFATLAKQVGGSEGKWIQIAILLVFGLLLFYATRVGEGKQIRRFSLPVLVLLDIPCIYIIAASMLKKLPFNEQLAATDGVFPMILMLAVIALGYGIPYTFLSGYEMQFEEADEAEEEDSIVKGGIAEELAEAEKDDDDDKAEAVEEKDETESEEKATELIEEENTKSEEKTEE